MMFTTKSGAKALGIKQDTLRHYAGKFGVGSQPGGLGTPWLFTKKELLVIRNRAGKHERIEEREDRKALGLGASYNADVRRKKYAKLRKSLKA